MPKPQSIDYTSLSYVALRRLKVGSSWREPGDAVPEAAHWRNLSNYLSAGHLAVVSGKNHPGVRQAPVAKHTQITKPQAQKPFTHHRPVDHTGTPASVPIDEL